MTQRLGALFRKELRTLFASPVAYIVLTAYVALTGVYFFQHLLNYNRLLFVFQSEGIGTKSFDSGTIPAQVNSLNELFIPAANDFSLFLLAVLPLVTMRVFAEERAQGTDELLLTTPLRSWEVVCAKHGTTYLFVMLMLGASAIFPCSTLSCGEMDSSGKSAGFQALTIIRRDSGFVLIWSIALAIRSIPRPPQLRHCDP